MNSFFKIYGRVISVLGAIILGALLPQFHVFSFLIQYFLMLMLFLAFLGIEIQPRAFRKEMLWVLLANIAIAFLAYWVISFFDHTLALAAFITAIAPTAIGSPVIISFIDGQVEYLVASILLTNLSMALIVPISLPFLIGSHVSISVWQILKPVVTVVFAPLILAYLVARLPEKAQTFIGQGKRYSFTVWLVNLFIVCATAADFIRNEDPSTIHFLLKIALISFVICVANFSLGALIGGREHWQEASQALGQKNTSFVIWVALTFINPLMAIGPTFYILYHNLYNSLQIYLFEKRRNV